jgi:hypothetical protein
MSKPADYRLLAQAAAEAAALAHLPHDRVRLLQLSSYWLHCAAKADQRARPAQPVSSVRNPADK